MKGITQIIGAIVVLAITLYVANSFIPAATLAGTSTPLTPTKDTYASQASPPTNYGGSTGLYIESQSAKIRRPFLGFSMAAIPSNNTITNVQLKLYQLSSSSNIITVNVWYCADSLWGESTLTWNNHVSYWTTTSCNVVGSFSSAGAGVTKSVPLQIVQFNNELKTGDKVFTLVLTAFAEGTPTSSLGAFNSKESGGSKPNLVIDFKPDEPSAVCGNNVKEGSEQCDLGISNGACPSVCSSSCTTNPCAVCGNSIIESGEICDSTNLNGQTCVSRGYNTGTLKCNADCKSYDVSLCSNYVCGNSIIEGSEQCEGTNTYGQTCQSLGYTCGQLSCNALLCKYDTTQCYSTNLNIDKNNCGTCGTVCKADQTCVSGQCTYICGDFKANGAEQCDFLDLKGQTCQSLGYTCGQLSCTSSCTYSNSCYTTDLASDTKNCGSCGTICGAGDTCFNNECRDITLPTISIKRFPQADPITTNNVVTLDARASDNKQIAQIKIFIDNSNTATCFISTCLYSANLVSGKHTYYAIASDTAGNTARSPATGSYELTISPFCGNSICELGEDPIKCNTDCKTTPQPVQPPPSTSLPSPISFDFITNIIEQIQTFINSLFTFR